MINLGPKSVTKFLILSTLFITALLMANILASKLFTVAGLVMTAGIIAFPMTFLLTDIINDVWGKRLAQKVVLVGFMANVVMLGFLKIGLILPPVGFWEGQGSFEVVLGAVPRIVAASMVAYLISQSWDVWMFSKIKEKMHLGLWFRNNASTFTSQAIDSAIFLTLAFAGAMPWVVLGEMYVAYIIVKWLIAAVDTPFCYLGVKWARSTIDE